ncbi:type III restriction endonuclease subunit R [Enterobacter asburiae]|nr:type III restriction endonuclease subunit R [Enterobacter asburiae]
MINPTSVFTKFKYVSAECGSGKTTKLCEMINEVLTIEGNTNQFIIVQNTQKLAKQTAKNFADYKLIISEVKNSKKNVLTSVLDFLNKPTSRVLIISDKTFFKIPVDLLQGWQIWLDDVTNFHSYKCINDGNQCIKDLIYHALMKDHEIVDEGTGKYLTAKKKDVRGDILYKVAQELSVISENDIFIMNNDYFKKPDKVQLNILGWKDLKKHIGLPITFMGANFENSLIYKANVSLFKKTELDGLLTRQVQLEDRLKVYYFSENKKLSKGWKDNNSEKVKCIYDYLDAELDGKDFYWTNNEKDTHKLKNGTKISPDTRGLNDYIELNTCVWLACMRPDDTEAKLCELLLGITGEDIHLAREYENLHQFALRGVSRVYDSTEQQIVYVFDKYQAESLSTNIEHIPGVLENVTQGVPGRPRGAKNVNKFPELSGKKTRLFNRWKAANPGLEMASFHEFLNSATNRDLSTEDKAAIWSRYDSAVQKKQKLQSQSKTPT